MRPARTLSLIFGLMVLSSAFPRAVAQQPEVEEILPAMPLTIVPLESPSSGPVERRSESRSEDTIETDRDSFTPATTTAGRKRLIVESSYSFIDNRRTFETHSFPELLLRYGITERIELRLGWNYEVGGGGNVVSSAEGGEAPEGSGVVHEFQMLYGVKVRVSEQRNWLPGSSLLVQGFTPTSGKDPATQMAVGYVFGWELPNRWKLDAAIRYGSESEEGDRFSVWAPSTVLKVPIGERVNVHAEYFGLFSRDRREDFAHHFFSPGVHYLVTPNLEAGVRVGWGLNDQSARFFSNVGLGWQF